MINPDVAMVVLVIGPLLAAYFGCIGFLLVGDA